MSSISSYPKVHTLGHKRIQSIFQGDYHLEEKIDGSQISFGLLDGELKIRSKGKELFVNNPEKMFAKGIECVQQAILEPGFVYRGEYLQKPKHNTLAYNQVPKNHIIIFDIEDIHGNPVDYKTKRDYAIDAGFECVPKITAEINNIDDFLELLKRESCLGGPTIEGVVVKNYNQFTPEGKYMLGKYVSEKFKEKHQTEWKKSNPGRQDIIQHIVDEIKTEARWEKAIQHMRENGELQGGPQDIGLLIKEVHKDIDDEEADAIKDLLYKHFSKQIKRQVAAGLPEWYKQKLLSRSF